MSSSYGERLRITIFGQSHSPAIGVSIEGLPPGVAVDMEELRGFLRRRAPGRSALATARVEEDAPEVLSGLAGGVTCGAPLAIIIRNTDARSADYREICDVPRPSHADYAAHVKYGGHQDVAGGGHFSGRLTAPLCAAGGICIQILRGMGVSVGAHILQIGDCMDAAFDPVNVSEKELAELRGMAMPVLGEAAGKAMRRRILAAKEAGDSVGGVVECVALGLPAGLGNPIFGGIENRVASIIFGIPGVKGVEFGDGFGVAGRCGSANNDPFYMEGGIVKTRTNHCGGILGGITNGMPVIFRAAFKPTPSIALEQESVSLSRAEPATLRVAGRHDPCIVTRAVPCVEAAAAIALYDAFLDR